MNENSKELEWIEIQNNVKKINKFMKLVGFNITTRDIFIKTEKKEEEEHK
jgi:hypothetical protein